MYKFIRPFLFAQDAENAHNRMHLFGKWVGHSWLKTPVSWMFNFEDARLNTTVCGMEFKNPVGLAAGFDKQADLIEALPAVGFGFTEIGSITALPREGNPRPRLFRLEQDEAIINRMGLNNEGATATAAKLKKMTFPFPVGINIAKTHDPDIMGDKAIQDFVMSFQTVYPIADYMTVNVSCPNTAEGKTFEEPDTLNELLSALRDAEKQFSHKKPLFVKLSPDRTVKQIESIVQITAKYQVSGYVLTNTSSGRAHLTTPQSRVEEIGLGGLSGKPIQKMSTEVIGFLYTLLEHPVIIGVGGIFTAEDAYEKIRAGASLVQAYTGVVYQGPGFARQINTGLVRLLKRDGFSSLKQAVGANHV